MLTIKLNHWLPKFLKMGAVTIGSTIYVAGADMPIELFVHEYVHVKQYKNLGVPGFLFLYFAEYVRHFITNGFNHSKAYRAISFEAAAYERQTYPADNEELDLYSRFKKGEFRV